MNDEEKVEKHPAFGLATFSRAQIGGGKRHTRLFGSSIESMNVIMLEISRASVHHSLGEDRFFDEEQLIMVEMTEAQFAALLTTMNVGSGVPVTIRRFNGKGTPDLPEVKVEAMKIRDKFHEDMTRWQKQMETITDEVDAIISKKGALTIVEKDRLRDLSKNMVQQMKSHSTFLLDQFNESVDRVLTEAKAEIEGFINAAVQKTGLQALKGRAQEMLGMEVDHAKGQTEDHK